MGRKALNKKRYINPEKQMEWGKQLIPQLQKSGLKDVTMDEVARMLNVSKATVYKYFKSREEIISLCVALKLDEIRYFNDLLTDKKIPYLDRYFKSIEHLTIHIADVSNIFLLDLKQYYPETWLTVMGFIDFALETIKDYYSEGIREGVLEDAAPALMVMSDRFFFQALSDPDFLISHQLTLKDAFRQYFRLKFFGIVKDRKKIEKYSGRI